MSQHSEAIQPVYKTEFPNQPIEIYKGRMTLHREIEGRKSSISGNGVLKFEWAHQSKVTFELNHESPSRFFFHGNNASKVKETLEIEELNASIEVIASYFSGSEKIAYGSIVDDIEVGESSDLQNIQFHISNFHDYVGKGIEKDSQFWTGRLLLEVNDWKISIDSLEPTERKKLKACMRRKGGIAITHVGRIERIDGQCFNAVQCQNTLKELFYFLSFLRGLWVGIVLAVGFDNYGNLVWEKWSNQKTSLYIGVQSWFPIQNRTRSIDFLFANFTRLFESDEYKEPLMLAVHWYIESNLQAGAVEGSILMAQAAFEMLFEVILGSRSIKIKADKKLERLFQWASLPVDCENISADDARLHELKELIERSSDISNLPDAITRIRNRFTHPKHRKNEVSMVYETHVRIQAWQICMWYLELSILRWLEYNDVYKNRMKFNYEGDYENVPWLEES
ncbi:MAG: hypothetical protein ACFB0E_00135 [Leptolyngbyaceae cyanobacterium]